MHPSLHDGTVCPLADVGGTSRVVLERRVELGRIHKERHEAVFLLELPAAPAHAFHRPHKLQLHQVLKRLKQPEIMNERSEKIDIVLDHE